MKAPDERLTPTEQGHIPHFGPDAIRLELETLPCQYATDAVERFWPHRPAHPELNGNAVTQEELTAKVHSALSNHIIRNFRAFSALIQGAKDPLIAFEEISALLRQAAMEFSEMLYESLVYFKKIGIDELTGLSNRIAFDRGLTAGIERSGRFGEKFSVMFFDVDHFKQINDAHGHQAGDAVLRELARRLSQNVRLRKLDIPVRYGGDEFAIILPSTPQEGACILAQRISDQVNAEPFKIETNNGESVVLKVNVSIGVAEYANPTQDPLGKDVQRRADASLYVLKGREPDSDGMVMDRRGGIACQNRIITQEDIDAYKIKMSGPGRSSFPVSGKE